MDPGWPEDSHTLRQSLGRLLPSGVASWVAPIDVGAQLLAPEPALVANAVDRRRREFATGRQCARRALAQLGGPVVAIGRGPLGEPLWPTGFGGSISHGDRWCAAIAYRSRRDDAGDDVTIGIDLIDERDPTSFEDAFLIALTDVERRMVGCEDDRIHLIMEMFSAKEAAIKTVSPRLGHFVDFRDFVVVPAADGYCVCGPGGYVSRVRRDWLHSILITVAITPIDENGADAGLAGSLFGRHVTDSRGPT